MQRLDLSGALDDDRCILIGRLAKPLTEIRLTRSEVDPPETDQARASPGFQPEGRTESYLRIVLPVKTTKSR